MDIRKSDVNSANTGRRIGPGARITVLASCLALLVSGCFGASFEVRCGWADMDDDHTQVIVPPPAPYIPPAATQPRSSLIPQTPPTAYAYPQYRYGPPPSTWDSRHTATAVLVLSGLGIAAAGSRIEDHDAQMGVMGIGGALTVLGGLTAISFAFDDDDSSYRYSMGSQKTSTELVFGPGSATLAYTF